MPAPQPVSSQSPASERAARFRALLAQGRCEPGELLALYDDLAAIAPSFLLGSWQGGEIDTGTLLNGQLRRLRWHGKTFYAQDHVAALVHRFRWWSPVGLAGILLSRRSRAPGGEGKRELLLGRACLRELPFRGTTSTAMVYDLFPVTDHFRKVDDDTVMGVMQTPWRRIPPFFFYLERER